jgi:RNA 2',3'-cyclic 3'-phosphodiesterase
VSPGGGADARERTRRVFFALWPDDSLRTAFTRTTQNLAASSGGRPVPARNLHITLLFLGSVPEDRLSELEALAIQAARTSGASSGELIFNRLEYWKRPRVLVATTSPRTDAAVAGALATELLEASRDAGFLPDLKSLGSADSQVHPFLPHITLARKVPAPIPPVDIDPLPWRYTRFVLVQSQRGANGSEYSVIATFPLRSAQG